MGALPSGVVTFLLTDIEGSTALWDADAAAMADALQLHDDLVGAAVAANNGTLLKSKGEGDSTFSVFRRASDAVRAAVTMQAHIQAAEWSTPQAIRVRAAVHTGEAIERAGDYFGPTVNRVARLRALAAGGEVLVSEATAQVTVDHLPPAALEELGEHELRGMTRPEAVYRLVLRAEQTESVGTASTAVRRTRPPAPALLRDISGMFVGRAEELQVITALADECAAGEPRLLLLGGEPGIGKTTLAAHFAQRAYADGATVLYGRCDEGFAAAYQPFTEALTAYARSVPVDRLATDAGPGAGDLARIVPEITMRLPNHPPPMTADAESERLAVFDAVARLLSAAARGGGLTLVVDDVQWASPPTLMLLRHVLRAVQEPNVLIIATYRDTELGEHGLASLVTDAARDPAIHRLTLRGLAADDVGRYLEAMAGRALDAGAEEFAAALVDRTRGNPFFVVEVVRSLVSEGVVYDADGEWTSAVSADQLPLSEQVRDVIAHRIAHLPKSCQEALGVGAVMGRAFSLPILESVLGRDALEDLEHAVSAGLLVEQDAGFAFSHALLTQALYEDMSAARRARVHRGIADALSRQPEVDPNLVVHHFIEGAGAGGLDEAVKWGVVAAHKAMGQLDLFGARMIVDRLNELLPPAIDVERHRLELMLVDVVIDRERGASDDCRRKSTEVIAAARAAGFADILVLAVNEYASYVAPGYIDDAIPVLITEALAMTEGSDPGATATLKALLARYLSNSGGDVVEALQMAEAALSAARETDDPQVLRDALLSRVLTASALEPSAKQLPLLDELVALNRGRARPLFDKYNRAAYPLAAQRIRAAHRLQGRDREGFLADLAGHGDDARKLRFAFEEGMNAALRVMWLLMRGEFDEADRVREADIAPLAGAGDWNLTTAYLGTFAYGERERGRVAELRPGLTSAVESRGAIAAFRALLAVVDADLGDTAAATDGLRELIDESFANVPRDTIFWVTIALLAEAAATAGAREFAAPLRAELSRVAGELVTTGWGVVCMGAVDRYIGMMALLEGHVDEAITALESARDAESALEAAALVCRTEYWLARAYAERGDARGYVLAEQCAASADDLGMATLAAMARAVAAAG